MSIPTVLLVDDVKLLLELEKNFLKHSAVRLLTASNGEEALDVARREHPNLIYMDLNMPKMDGKSCCAAIKADPELCSIPVIMVTTAGSQIDEIRCREAGCDDYLTKPIDRRLFLEKGRRFVPAIDRREPRVSCMAEVALVNGEVIGSANCADISVGGLYITADKKPQTDEDLKISFTLPGSNVKIKAKGRVAWDNSGNPRSKPRLPAGFGVEFTEIETEVLKEIRNFIESQRAKGG
ncbi:polar-differentiation response regulator DivK [Geobacter sp. OR-1]|nr:polar-differentiation response regulator DivK [Geobacter sp. OR-1]